MRRRKVNKQARRLVQLAIEKGMSYDDVATLCGVSVGSVKRWFEIGRADAKAIQPLVNEFGRLRLSPETVAKNLIEIYRMRGKTKGKRYRVRAADLVKIAGRARLKSAFLDNLAEALEERRYLLIPEEDKGEKIFFVINVGQMKKHIPYTLKEEDIEAYYQDVAEEIDDEDVDEEEEE